MEEEETIDSIQEIRTRRRLLEHDLGSALRRFEEETKCRITCVYYNTIGSSFGDPPTLSMEVELGGKPE